MLLASAGGNRVPVIANALNDLPSTFEHRDLCTFVMQQPHTPGTKDILADCEQKMNALTAAAIQALSISRSCTRRGIRNASWIC